MLQAFIFTAGFHRTTIRPEGFVHIHDWGDEISPVNQCFIQRGQCEESPDAVGNQGEVLTPASLFGEKCEKLFVSS